MRITAAAQRLGTSPRMLRYRESLGLLPAIREHPPGRPRGALAPAARGAAARGREPAARGRGPAARAAAAPRHRRFDDADLDAIALGLAIEQRYDISPAALSFGMRVLSDPGVRAEVAELGRRIGRIQPPPARAIDFEKERALRLLSISDGRSSPGGPSPGGPSPGGPSPGGPSSGGRRPDPRPRR
jgi:MerR family transcriptional regulator, copper efflux regulator